MDHATLESMRIRAVGSIQAGESPDVVARSLRVSLRIVRRRADRIDHSLGLARGIEMHQLRRVVVGRQGLLQTAPVGDSLGQATAALQCLCWRTQGRLLWFLKGEGGWQEARAPSPSRARLSDDQSRAEAQTRYAVDTAGRVHRAAPERISLHMLKLCQPSVGLR
jgi:hypothetical protein